MFWKREIGNRGESLAIRFLKKKGLKILEHPYRVKTGEVDIVAQDHETYCFVEVKARSGAQFGKAIEAVDRKKREQMAKVALWYLQSHQLMNSSSRFDVVAIQYGENGEPPQIEWIQNAFELGGEYQW